MKRDYCAGLIRAQMDERSIVLCAMGSTGAAWRAQKAPHLTYFVSDPMGMALPMSLGVALAQPGRPVVLLDGDGDFSTGVSALFAIAGSAPPNLKIAVFNNAKYESGGGQPLPGADRMSLSLLARGAGLSWSEDVSGEADAPEVVTRWLKQPTTALLVFAIDVQASPYPPPGPWSKGEERAFFMQQLRLQQ
jgi:thiamine pyrophosphate-dependent acetolactate synthase large subunit-like protein